MFYILIFLDKKSNIKYGNYQGQNNPSIKMIKTYSNNSTYMICNAVFVPVRFLFCLVTKYKYIHFGFRQAVRHSLEMCISVCRENTKYD